MYQLDIVIKVKTKKDVEKVKYILKKKIEQWLEEEERCNVVMVTDLDWPTHDKNGVKFEKEDN
jgi:hypothetical protein